jgi:prepilin-type processing-associated H-X9-DG protein
LATQLYWDDHRGIAFVERGARTNQGWNYWFGWLEDGAEGERRFEPSAGALWPYLRSRGVEVCPALNRIDPRFKSKAHGAAFGYGYNLRIGTRGTSGIAIATLRSPAGCAVFADCAQVNDFQPPASPDHPLLEEFYYFDLEGPTVHFRHSRRTQAWFADGHVAGGLPAPGSEDPRLPTEHIARLPAELILP